MGRIRDALGDQQSEAGFDALFPTPVCILGIRTEGDMLTGIRFLPKTGKSQCPRNATANKAWEALESYLADPGFQFSLKLKIRGTEHQRAVWSQMQRIQPGQTLTYGELATRLSSSPRAVGQACGANSIPVVIPCHRVVASGGLGGFAHHSGGFLLEVKRWLLTHEHALW
jgi:methylated-DNA-[protein]-cysteine S-methyltransferase